ncbi:MAG: GNAT family N-acetyltransferase [Myxococcota bacterium]|nr:GNAT family N-acetyltransferase [Myxococcota bacterium]
MTLGVPSEVRVGRMAPGEVVEVVRRLRREPRHNLLLLDLIGGGVPWPGGGFDSPEAVVARSELGVLGIASLRPCMVLEAEISEAGLEAVIPFLSSMDSGLIKSQSSMVDLIWEKLHARGRRAVLDRYEEAYVLAAADSSRTCPQTETGDCLRRAKPDDLEDLVYAARSSLREENRPDPFRGDPHGFRRWVENRMGQARLLEVEGQLVFVGYADVRRPEGWLIQGVYTWPEQRRRGYGRAGMQGMVREAVAAGAEHVQLAVVEGNQPALGLYGGLGFQPLSRLRTILFR